jgi:cell division protein FtsZ
MSSKPPSDSQSSNASQPEKTPRGARRKSPAEKKVRIKVIGVGGAGVNAVDRLVLDGQDEISLLALNTDAQALASCVVTEKLQIGESLTHGLGAGGDPDVGRSAAEEDIEQIRDLVEGYDLIFVAAGMGGGTGTGAGPVIARVAREEGALVLALVTMPFTHEGRRRMEIAHEGFRAMQDAADAVICIPNDKLLDLADENTSVLDAFRPTDEFLSKGVARIWQMLRKTGLINIDFADLRSVLRRSQGETLFGFGEGSGANKLDQALENALRSPLLSDQKILAKASSVLIGVTHGPDFTMAQLKSLMEKLHKNFGPESSCKQGIIVDENYTDKLTVVVIASTGQPLDGREKVEARKSLNSGTSRTGLSGSEENETPSEEGMTDSSEIISGRGKRKKTGVHELITDSARQQTLKLDESTRGLFERVEKTLINGEDLDRPTFIRRGIVLRNVNG